MILKKPIVLVGMMGAGKTSFGRKIAKKLHAQFFDLDNEIKTKTGYSPKEIFNYFGESLLKDTEFSTIEELLKISSSIIATGDSTIDNKKAWEYIKENSVTIWLNIDLKLISVRLKPNEDRPYLDETPNESILNVLKQLYYKRAKKYKEAHLTIHRPILNKKTFLKKLTQVINKLQENEKVNFEEFWVEEISTKTKENENNNANNLNKRKKHFKHKNKKKNLENGNNANLPDKEINKPIGQD